MEAKDQKNGITLAHAVVWIGAAAIALLFIASAISGHESIKNIKKKDHLMIEARMTPAEFKAHYRGKGWTGRALAARWDLSEEWVSKIGNNPERDIRWDDSVRGLPKAK